VPLVEQELSTLPEYLSSPLFLIKTISNGQHSLKLFLILIEEILSIKRNENVDTTMTYHKIDTTCATRGAGTAYYSGAPEFTPIPY